MRLRGTNGCQRSREWKKVMKETVVRRVRKEAGTLNNGEKENEEK